MSSFDAKKSYNGIILLIYMLLSHKIDAEVLKISPQCADCGIIRIAGDW
jgi:hypothetical protein